MPNFNYNNYDYRIHNNVNNYMIGDCCNQQHQNNTNTINHTNQNINMSNNHLHNAHNNSSMKIKKSNYVNVINNYNTSNQNQTFIFNDSNFKDLLNNPLTSNSSQNNNLLNTNSNFSGIALNKRNSHGNNFELHNNSYLNKNKQISLKNYQKPQSTNNKQFIYVHNGKKCIANRNIRASANNIRKTEM